MPPKQIHGRKPEAKNSILLISLSTQFPSISEKHELFEPNFYILKYVLKQRVSGLLWVPTTVKARQADLLGPWVFYIWWQHLRALHERKKDTKIQFLI